MPPPFASATRFFPRRARQTQPREMDALALQISFQSLDGGTNRRTASTPDLARPPRPRTGWTQVHADLEILKDSLVAFSLRHCPIHTQCSSFPNPRHVARMQTFFINAPRDVQAADLTLQRSRQQWPDPWTQDSNAAAAPCCSCAHCTTTSRHPNSGRQVHAS